jgi:hypothetical protein
MAWAMVILWTVATAGVSTPVAFQDKDKCEAAMKAIMFDIKLNGYKVVSAGCYLQATDGSAKTPARSGKP